MEVIRNLIVTHILLIGMLIFFFIVILLYIRKVRLRRKFERFSLTSIKEEETSIFDEISDLIWKEVQNFSKVVEKIPFLKLYGKRYDKYIPFDENAFKKGIDYVSLKLLISFLFLLLYSFSSFFKVSKLNGIGFILAILGSFFITDIFLLIAFQKKRKKIEEDFLKSIMIMNNCFNHGGSIMQAIDTVKEELDGPIASEFAKISLDISYGLSLEVVFNRFYERTGLRDAKYIAMTLSMLNKTGGNIKKVFRVIEKTIYNRKQLEKEVKGLTSISKFVSSLLILSIPILCISLCVLKKNAYNFSSPFALLLFFILFILYVLYITAIHYIVKVDVE